MLKDPPSHGVQEKKKEEERKGEKKQQQKIRTITKNENYNKHRIAADTLEKLKVCLKWPLEGKTRLPRMKTIINIE